MFNPFQINGFNPAAPADNAGHAQPVEAGQPPAAAAAQGIAQALQQVVEQPLPVVIAPPAEQPLDNPIGELIQKACDLNNGRARVDALNQLIDRLEQPELDTTSKIRPLLTVLRTLRDNSTAETASKALLNSIIQLHHRLNKMDAGTELGSSFVKLGLKYLNFKNANNHPKAKLALAYLSSLPLAEGAPKAYPDLESATILDEHRCHHPLGVLILQGKVGPQDNPTWTKALGLAAATRDYLRPYFRARSDVVDYLREHGNELDQEAFEAFVRQSYIDRFQLA